MRTLLLLLLWNYSFAQNFTGTVLNKQDNTPVEYVNIGIPGKDIGTVSDRSGIFNISLTETSDNDTLLFSCTGYQTVALTIGDLNKNTGKVFFMSKLANTATPVRTKLSSPVKKTLGITSRSKISDADMEGGPLGSEWGIIIKTRKPALLENVIINLKGCTFDSIFYRLNIYRIGKNKDFKNILTRPVYVKLSKDEYADEIIFNILEENIVVSEDFLITLEQVAHLGKGSIKLCSNLWDETYLRSTSHGKWETLPIGFSISVDALVEK